VMLEYLPWSRRVLAGAMALYERGRFSILDIELGGACNLGCIYCDSPNRTVTIDWEVPQISRLLASEEAQWLFVCGLGEPLASKNQPRFAQLLELCDTHSVRCSTFTNGFSVDGDVRGRVQDGTLSLLVKLDSLDPSVGDSIYGANAAKRMLENLELLAGAKVVDDGTTNLAVSIVPTRLNVHEVPAIVERCLSMDVYPVIGQLEDAGLGKAVLQEIGLSPSELVIMRQEVSAVIGDRYEIPTCPAVVAGLHVDHAADLIVDRSTGLSCHWFWLKTPETCSLLNLSNLPTWEQCGDAVLRYRAASLPGLEATLEGMAAFPLGGCGGDARRLLQQYARIERGRLDDSVQAGPGGG
jgi:hypothetical protein